MSPLLFQSIPHLAKSERLSWIPLVNDFTPVHLLPQASDIVGHDRLYIKREDATDSLYGGNKVRNLEFLLGTAIARGAQRVAALGPYGSNFIAAMAAQTRRINMPSEVFHFVPSLSEQMQMHAAFSERQGMQLNVFSGGKYFGVAKAQAALLTAKLLDSNTALIPAGGSSAIGVLGHINAVFELAEQIRAGEIPEPDLIIVGVGTCGTMAGLLAGIQVTGLKTKVIGVRCVDPIFCNSMHIAYLANKALRLIGARSRILRRDIDLRDTVDKISYGEPLPQAAQLIQDARNGCGIELDTTYTTKVFSYMQSLARSQRLQGLDVLYWHTFSPAATRSVCCEPGALHATA